jgi:hypothetical protein
MKNWNNTRTSYIKWLSKTKLRKEFTTKIKFDDFSLWWTSNLVEKYNRHDDEWYKNLNKKLNTKEKVTINRVNYLILSLKLIKNFFFTFIFLLIVKLFFFNNTKGFKNKKNCFYSLFINFTSYKGKYIDRQYGLTHLSNNKKKIFLIELDLNYKTLFQLKDIKHKLKKSALDYFILQRQNRFLDIFNVYYKTFILLLKTCNILKKEYFLINNIDCQEVLKPLVITSFFGQIQRNILNGIALERSLNIIKPHNFITNLIFYPTARTQYHYAKKSSVNNIINVNHAIYSEQNIIWNFNKNDFSNKLDDYYSPKPDIFLCKGYKDYQKLKNFFSPKNIYQIGCLKADLRLISQKKKIDKKKIIKIISVLTGETDINTFIKILNESDLSQFIIYLDTHPHNREKVFELFKKKLKIKFIDSSNIKKAKLYQISDFILFGDTQLGLELAIKNYKVIKVYEKEFVPQYNVNNEVPLACNKSDLLKLLNKDKLDINKKTLEKNYFYKYDGKASLRMERILEKI